MLPSRVGARDTPAMRDDGRVSISSVPVGQPLHGATFWQAVTRFFQGYVRFSGRASRSEFWWAMLASALIGLVAQVPFWIAWASFMVQAVSAGRDGSSSAPADILAPMGAMLGWMGIVLLASLALLLPSLALMWRRLQDAGFHGALSLLSIAGLGIVPLIMCCLPSSPSGAQYDPAYRAQLAAQATYPGAYGQPAYADPAFGQAVQGDPQYGRSAYGQSTYGQPAYGQPAYGQPAYGQPAYGEPGSDARRYGEPDERDGGATRP